MTPQQVLTAARAKIADPANWTQNALARDINDSDRPDSHPLAVHAHWEGIAGNDPLACKWCALGAIQAAIGDDLVGFYHASNALFRASSELFGRYSIADLNDTLGHEAVLQCYDKAIKDAS